MEEERQRVESERLRAAEAAAAKSAVAMHVPAALPVIQVAPFIVAAATNDHGWIESVDTTTGRTFYHHSGRGESTWHVPAELMGTEMPAIDKQLHADCLPGCRGSGGTLHKTGHHARCPHHASGLFEWRAMFETLDQLISSPVRKGGGDIDGDPKEVDLDVLVDGTDVDPSNMSSHARVEACATVLDRMADLLGEDDALGHDNVREFLHTRKVQKTLTAVVGIAVDSVRAFEVTCQTLHLLLQHGVQFESTNKVDILTAVLEKGLKNHSAHTDALDEMVVVLRAAIDRDWHIEWREHHDPGPAVQNLKVCLGIQQAKKDTNDYAETVAARLLWLAATLCLDHAFCDTIVGGGLVATAASVASTWGHQSKHQNLQILNMLDNMSLFGFDVCHQIMEQGGLELLEAVATASEEEAGPRGEVDAIRNPHTRDRCHAVRKQINKNTKAQKEGIRTVDKSFMKEYRRERQQSRTEKWLSTQGSPTKGRAGAKEEEASETKDDLMAARKKRVSQTANLLMGMDTSLMIPQDMLHAADNDDSSSDANADPLDTIGEDDEEAPIKLALQAEKKMLKKASSIRFGKKTKKVVEKKTLKKAASFSFGKTKTGEKKDEKTKLGRKSSFFGLGLKKKKNGEG